MKTKICHYLMIRIEGIYRNCKFISTTVNHHPMKRRGEPLNFQEDFLSKHAKKSIQSYNITEEIKIFKA